jgi:hypothetical protein
MQRVKIIGAGLAGSEAAWQCARRGVQVELFEMRPVRSTPAHQTGDFAELVCSNSLKSESENTAPWLLKEEMRRCGSLLIEIARGCAVPAGHALAVDRAAFAAKVTEVISREPLISIRREEVTEPSDGQITIVATGPLTTDALAGEIARLSAHLGIPNSPQAEPALCSRAGRPRRTAQPHTSIFMTPSISSKPTPLTCRVSIPRRVATKAPPITSTARCQKKSTTAFDALLAAEPVESKDWRSWC